MRELTVDEAEVIEAAQDLCQAWEGAHYGPGKKMVRDATKALQAAMQVLWNENEDQPWLAPKEMGWLCPECNALIYSDDHICAKAQEN